MPLITVCGISIYINIRVFCGQHSEFRVLGMAVYIHYNTLNVEEQKTNLMSLDILFHFLCAQHVSDINISIIRSLRLCC